MPERSFIIYLYSVHIHVMSSACLQKVEMWSTSTFDACVRNKKDVCARPQEIRH